MFHVKHLKKESQKHEVIWLNVKAVVVTIVMLNQGVIEALSNSLGFRRA